ncbi:AMP-binding protein, partial [Mucilaginibacter sp. RCC_168]|uniref:AMP-binding protein n=1 Tax=Mucilaginibacter sp. RCC_168 TaxID=3239221 RepID=UPI0035241EDD
MNKKLIHEVFEKQVESSSDRTAVQDGFNHITYTELNSRANQLGHLLINLDLGDCPIVATLMPSGIELISTILGIFKTGGIYLPLDESFSESRFRHIFFQTKPIVLITMEGWKEKVQKWVDEMKLEIPHMLVLGEDSVGLFSKKANTARSVKNNTLPLSNLKMTVDENSGNYIVYTSGSTGGGKAILGCHKGLSHFIHWEIE